MDTGGNESQGRCESGKIKSGRGTGEGGQNGEYKRTALSWLVFKCYKLGGRKWPLGLNSGP